MSENSSAADFYKSTLALPVIRALPGVQVHWGGEALIYELMLVKGRSIEPAQDTQSAACIPVFRVHELDSLVTALTAAGTPLLEMADTWHGRQALLQDPEGRLFGLREQAIQSPLVEDQIAQQRWLRGETFNPGCARMPAQIQELGWIIRRVTDVAAMTRFYTDVLGLRVIGRHADHVYISLGDNVLLQLIPGGVKHVPVTDRSQGTDTFLLRVSDADELRSRLRAANVTFVNEKLEYYWTEICYCTDPDGHMFGFQQIRHPGIFAPRPAWPENIEAQRRWVETQAVARG